MQQEQKKSVSLWIIFTEYTVVGTCKTRKEVEPLCKKLWLELMVDENRSCRPSQYDPEYTLPSHYSKEFELDYGYSSDQSELVHLMDEDDVMQYVKDDLIAEGNLLLPKMNEKQIEQYFKDVRWTMFNEEKGVLFFQGRGTGGGNHIAVRAQKITIDI